MRWLAGLACIEAGLVLVGLAASATPPGEPPLPPPAPAVHAEPAAPAPRALVEHLLARPLFAAGRRPPRPGVVAATMPTPVPSPRLTGIVLAGPLRRAVFAAGQSKPISAGEGETVGPFHVRAIGAEWVDLDGPSGPSRLWPDRDTDLRERLAYNAPPVPLVDPYLREAETENDQ